jgi:hypothetical protein
MRHLYKIAFSCCVILLGGMAFAQDDPAPDTPPVQAAASDSEAPTGENDGRVRTISATVRDMTQLRPGRPALLREGSQLIEVVGTLTRDAEHSQWVFTVKDENFSAAQYELIVLPGTMLGEIEAVVASVDWEQFTFEMTGEVLVYRARNYFMPSHPPRLLQGGQAPQDDADKSAPSADAAGDTTQSEDAPAPGGDDDSVEALMHELDESSGIAVVQRDDATSADDDHTFSLDDSRPILDHTLVQEGTQLVNRRGRIRREGGGAWVFVLDADATGLGDPPMRLLPCRLLERIETITQRRGNGAEVLLSGRVFVYRNRNYLLPTVFRLPRSHTKLEP